MLIMLLSPGLLQSVLQHGIQNLRLALKIRAVRLSTEKPELSLAAVLAKKGSLIYSLCWIICCITVSFA